MNLPKRTVDIKINENTYVINFPNNGQLMRIYSRRAQLSREQFDTLSLSLDGNANYVSHLICAVSAFEVLMPEQFTKDLNAESILSMDVLKGAELVKAYQDQFVSWFDEWIAAIANVLKSKTKEKPDA